MSSIFKQHLNRNSMFQILGLIFEKKYAKEHAALILILVLPIKAYEKGNLADTTSINMRL